MANADIRDFYFWFKYLWDSTNDDTDGEVGDFYDFQTWMNDRFAGIFETLLGGAALSGLNPSLVSGMDLQVSAGTAVTASGRLMVLAANGNVSLATPVGNPARSLVVLRPTNTDMTSIPRPTDQDTNVYKHKKLGCSLVVLDGTASATPAYPAITTGDIVLFGVRLASGQSTVALSDLDFSQRDFIGKNGLGPLTSKNDDRCRPYRSATAVLGIKPSQDESPLPRRLLYSGNLSGSIFPKTAGAYTNSDALVNFTTGAITGGDADSPDFTPTLPTAGSYIWAIVCLKSDDTLMVRYGTAGTYAQCKAALAAQTTSGAGSVPLRMGYPIALVLLGSSGAAIVDMEIVDARGMAGQLQGQGKFSFANNQGSFADVTGLAFDHTQFRSFVIRYDIYRKTATGATEAREVGLMYAMYSVEDATWTLDFDAHQRKNDVGITWGMSGDQLQYKTTNIAGVSGVHNIEWRILDAFNL